MGTAESTTNPPKTVTANNETAHLVLKNVDITVVLSVNSNPYYAAFWPLVREWWARVGVDVVLLYCDDGIHPVPADVNTVGDPQVVRIVVPSDLAQDPQAVVHVSQLLRLFWPALRPSSNRRVYVTGDIDGWLPSRAYFNKIFTVGEQYHPSSDFVSGRCFLDQGENTAVTAWYNGAISTIYRKVFGISTEGEMWNCIRKLLTDCKHLGHNGPCWFADQRLLYNSLTQWARWSKGNVWRTYSDGELGYVHDFGEGWNMLDPETELKRLLHGEYTAAHVGRTGYWQTTMPLATFKKQIRLLRPPNPIEKKRNVST